MDNWPQIIYLQLTLCCQVIVLKLIVIKNGDYTDAIKMGDLISSLDENIYFPEGGAKNPARRDGMGISLLAPVFEI